MSDYELIQEGRHRARCFGHELSYSSNKGTPTVALGFRMSEGDVDQGRVITAFRYPTDAALEYCVKDLRTCGWQGDDMGAMDDAELAANEVELVVEHEEYDGKLRAKVKWINPLGGGMIKSETPMDEKQKRDFGRAMAAKVRALSGGKKSTGGTDKHRETDTRDTHPNAPGGDGRQAPPPTDEWA